MTKWLEHCKTNYNKKQKNMKDKNIIKLWEDFMNDSRYKKYIQLPTMLEKFVFNLNNLKTYIDINKQKPPQRSNNKDIKTLSSWLSNQQNNYSKKINNMKDENIRKMLEEFLYDPKYKDYF